MLRRDVTVGVEAVEVVSRRALQIVSKKDSAAGRLVIPGVGRGLARTSREVEGSQRHPDIGWLVLSGPYTHGLYTLLQSIS